LVLDFIGWFEVCLDLSEFLISNVSDCAFTDLTLLVWHQKERVL